VQLVEHPGGQRAVASRMVDLVPLQNAKASLSGTVQTNPDFVVADPIIRTFRGRYAYSP